MNRATVRGRTAIAVLLTVALVGGIAGTITAYALHLDDPGRASTDPSVGAEAGRLLYYADGQIQDGGLEVPVQLSRDFEVSSLQRVGDGWLVVQLESEGGEQERYFGTYVYPDGSTWELGGLGRTWDIDGDGRILFTPEPQRWYAADPATHEFETLEIVEGAGDDPKYMGIDGEPAPWLLWGSTGVMTGWESSNGARMVLTETDDYTHTEAGPLGVERPNTSPNGRLAVGSLPARGAGGASHCLSGGKVTADRWWETCELMRVSYSSPYSPNGEQLLTRATDLQGAERSEFTIVDARTGRRQTRVAAPRGTYDAAWLDDDTLAVLAQARGTKTTRLYRVGLDSGRELVTRLDSRVVLGDG